jgi:hypothetical protein
MPGRAYNRAFLRANMNGRDQAARTPDALLRLVRSLFVGRARLYDPCPAGRDPTFDGLAVPWRRINYVNPPYDDVASWMAKAASEAELGRASVMLVPARPYTRYFAECAFARATHVVFLQNKVAFQGYPLPLPAPLMLVVFGTPPWDALARPPLPPSVALTRLPARLLDLGRGSRTVEDAFRLLRGLYGPFGHEALASRRPASELWVRRNLVCVMDDAPGHAKALRGFHARTPRAVTVCMYHVATHSRYFCEQVVPAASEVAFFVPCLSFQADGGRSTAGSMVVVYGTPGRRPPLLNALPTRTVSFLGVGGCAGGALGGT